MKKFLIITLLLIGHFAYSQDTTEFLIKPSWENPEVQVDSVAASFKLSDILPEKIIPKWFEPEPDVPEEELTEQDVKSLEGDVQFMADLPQSYDQLPKEDLKNVLTQIDNKINQLKEEIAKLIEQRAKQEVIKSKQSTLTVLEKEKSIINLTLSGGELRDANGNLIGQNDELKNESSKLKKYLYTAVGIAILLGLLTAIVLQRKRISVQDVEIEDQLNDINKKNTYLEHAARIIRHDMHSGINTYMPRGLSSLERRLTQEDIDNFKIAGPLKMIKDGLSHTQRVYKSVYEFTNLVKMHVVLDKSKANTKEVLQKYIDNTSYSNQVQIGDLMELEINETLFCNAIDNLIRNGLKYNDSPEKWVKVYAEGDNIIIEDNGRGLTQKQFEKAIKAQTEENSKNEIGLGLSICNAILKEHGFSFTCEKSEGQGTLIKINTKN